MIVTGLGRGPPRRACGQKALGAVMINTCTNHKETTMYKVSSLKSEKKKMLEGVFTKEQVEILTAAIDHVWTRVEAVAAYNERDALRA